MSAERPLLDHHRFQRWRRASLLFLQFEPFLATTVQQLGKVDADLFERDRGFRGVRSRSDATADEWERIGDSVTLSYLWVLGAYEVVRTMDETFKSLGLHELGWLTESTAIKRQFARLRIPLAKLQPAGAHRRTDRHFAYPALTAEHGIGWTVSADVVISRGELSTALLEYLESLPPDWRNPPPAASC